MSIRDELLQIKGDQELLFPDDVWQWARDNPNSLLHKQYQWDVEKAAREHWHWKSCQLIGIHIVNADTGVREMVSLSIDRKGDGGYRSVNDVLPDQTLREIMLADALRDLERVQLKYSRITELAEVWRAKDAVKERTPRRGRRSVSEQPAAPPS